jgi:integrase
VAQIRCGSWLGKHTSSLSPGHSPPYPTVKDSIGTEKQKDLRIHPAANAAGILLHAPNPMIRAPIQETQGKLLQYSLELKKNGKAETTIIPRIRMLKQIAKLCNLNNPEEVKTTLADLKWNGNTKKQFVITYSQYLKYLGLTWQAPKYRKQDKLPFIPTEQEIDQLIASTGKTTSTLLQTLKETGMRIGEAKMLKWTDINTQQKTINITPEKGSNPRILPINDKLINMLNSLNKRQDGYIFIQDIDSARTTFDKQRKDLATKLSNDRIRKITFHTLRHYKGTMEYHKTKDIMHVKYVLGHKQIECTLIYINLEQALFLTENEDFICKVAKTIEEALPLIEAGFTQATEYNGIKIFKKRK